MNEQAADDAAHVPAGGESASPEPDTTPQPFRDRDLPIEDRIANLLFLITIEEKMALVNTGIGVPRLGIPETDNAEGIHGLVMAGALAGGEVDVPTTTFPQTVGRPHT